jgi:hypothetical protein
VHRLRCITWMGDAAICQAAADEIERLRIQRDEARREICSTVVFPSSQIEYAKRRGWDLFAEATP